MDYKEFIKSVDGIACVLEVDPENTIDGIRNVAANEAYMLSVVDSVDDFVCDVPYTYYIKKDPNFEYLCYKCIKDRQPIHAYVDASFFNAWLDNFFIPLSCIENGKSHILFTYQMSPKADADKLADLGDTAPLVLKTCIKLRETKDFQKAMNSVIKDIRELCDANSCCILLTDFAKRKCQVLCEDRIEQMISMYDIANDKFFDVVDTWPDVIDGSNCCILVTEQDWKRAEERSPIWVKSLKEAFVETLVIFPLRSNDETIAYIWACNFDEERTHKIKETLEVTTFILSAEIANHQMIKQMQILSTTDLLTGVMNRNSMNNRIIFNDDGTLPIKAPYGVFFVDVNGLKTVNDTQGHIAGDELLRDVADTLTGIFGDYEVYRVGGDEFLVITPEVSEEDFNKLGEELNSMAERDGHGHYATGACHYSEVTDIRTLMQLADTRMYANKKEYYKRHPEYFWDRKNIREK